jgi:hypothetical protein
MRAESSEGFGGAAKRASLRLEKVKSVELFDIGGIRWSSYQRERV